MNSWILFWAIGFGCLTGALFCEIMVRYQIRHGIDPDNPEGNKRDREDQ